ncbi:hypothetical protein DFH06DRAFT_1147274 [Mycena polygramma]|nr:hypothetical protein DFH06DRAFT_1147274 [Mycena polygramma]
MRSTFANPPTDANETNSQWLTLHPGHWVITFLPPAHNKGYPPTGRDHSTLRQRRALHPQCPRKIATESDELFLIESHASAAQGPMLRQRRASHPPCPRKIATESDELFLIESHASAAQGPMLRQCRASHPPCPRKIATESDELFLIESHTSAAQGPMLRQHRASHPPCPMQRATESDELFLIESHASAAQGIASTMPEDALSRQERICSDKTKPNERGARQRRKNEVVYRRGWLAGDARGREAEGSWEGRYRRFIETWEYNGHVQSDETEQEGYQVNKGEQKKAALGVAAECKEGIEQ